MLKLRVRHKNPVGFKLTEDEFTRLIQLSYATNGKGYVDYATITFPCDVEVSIAPNGLNQSKERFKVVRKVKV